MLSGCQAAPEPIRPAAEAPKPSAFDRYLARSEPAFGWKKAAPGEFAAGDGDFNLRLTSQTWQSKNWTHRMQVFVPAKGKEAHSNAAIINLSFGSGTLPESFLGRVLADTTGAVVVNLFNVPNQPLYGRQEDPLVAYSFAQYLKTGDESWPLLFPMAKSATQAMNALDDWSQQTRNRKIERFILTGPSKRGWAAYFAAASDSRVVGLVPIVYNNLNLKAQAAHQREIWGELSPLTKPYQDIGFSDPKFLASNEKFFDAIDPYALRARLTMPKFVVAATNDEFWPLDATKFYYDDLSGEKAFFAVPNATHMLYEKAFPVVGAAASWSRRLLDKKPTPQISLSARSEGDETVFELNPQGLEEGARVRLWFASAPSRDFREAKWSALAVLQRAEKWQIRVPNARLWEKGKQAKAFAEIELAAPAGSPSGLRVSSNLWEGEK